MALLNKLLTPGGKFLSPPKGKHVLQRSESHCCEVNTLENLEYSHDAILARFLRFLEGIYFRKLPAESEWGDQF